MQSDDLGLACLLRSRIGVEFDGEAHLTDAEAQSIAAAIERLVAERDEARLLVTEANNSLYGSQGYFHSLNGGPFDKYHLSSAIEAMKARGNRQWTALFWIAHTFTEDGHGGTKCLPAHEYQDRARQALSQSPDDTGGQRK